MSDPAVVVIVSHAADETRAWGARIGRRAGAGDLILLHGDLGAGKTTLTQGIAEGLGIKGPVQSPTFTLVAEYDGRDATGKPLRLYHLDLYRLTSVDDLETFGFDEYLAPPDGVAVVEWPERAGGLIQAPYLLVRLETSDVDQRRLTFEAVPVDGRYAAWLAILQADAFQT